MFPHISQVNMWGGNGQSTRHLDGSQLDSHLFADPSCGKTGFPKSTQNLYNYFVMGKTKKDEFSYPGNTVLTIVTLYSWYTAKNTK
jgi:hypothetical protein